MPKSLLVILSTLVLAPVSLFPAGISVDAGLTPAQNRWIFRTQMRYMQRRDDPTAMNREMVTVAAPLVVAYGVTPSLTLMAREILIRRNMIMGGSGTITYGRSDILAMAKYKLLRRNTRHSSLGVAAVLGLEPPLGSGKFTSETWDLVTGLNGSFRFDALAIDGDMRAVWNGIGERDTRSGDVLSLNVAAAYRFAVGTGAAVAFAPVLESGFTFVSRDIVDGAEKEATGESVAYVSPGAKLTVSSFIVEALLQIPTWQDRPSTALSRGVGGLVGIRVML